MVSWVMVRFRIMSSSFFPLWAFSHHVWISMIDDYCKKWKGSFEVTPHDMEYRGPSNAVYPQARRLRRRLFHDTLTVQISHRPSGPAPQSGARAELLRLSRVSLIRFNVRLVIKRGPVLSQILSS